MNEKNIENLKARLMQLGFAASIEMELRCRICFAPSSFELVHTEITGADLARFIVRIERGEKDLYSLLYFQAALRKEISVPAELITMDQKMSGVNWRALAGNEFGQIDLATVARAFELLKELKGIGDYADVLKFKHWVDTPLEMLMPNLSGLKNRYEINERFYLFDDVHVISFAEAGRFLRAKWMERQVMTNKKLLIREHKSEKSASGGNGKLLLKKTRRSESRGLIKKA